MTNPTLDLMHAHASVRHYKTDPLPASLTETIVAAGQAASTSSNLQLYSVIAVTDAARREALSHLCGDQAQVARAPLFLVWCADMARLDHVCRLRGYTPVTEYVDTFLVAAVDVAIASQNTALAAESLGLGICYIGGIRSNPREVIRLLDLPRLVFPVVGMTVGYPEGTPRRRPRLPIQAVLHRERYRADQDQALQQYDRTMAKSGIYNEGPVPVPGRPGEMEEYGWLEHSARRVSQPGRAFLRAVLEEHGFPLT
jgi:FMN reductase (NADPH)